MKTITYPALVAVLSLTFSAHAFIYETPDEFSMGVDYNNDAVMDLVLVDRATGQITAGFGQVDGSFAWQEAQTSGVLNVAAATFGIIQDGSATQLMLTERTLNRAQGLTAGSSTPLVVKLPGFGPTMIIAVSQISDLANTTAGMITSVSGYLQQVQTGVGQFGLPEFTWQIEGGQTDLTARGTSGRSSVGIATTWPGAHGNDLGLNDLFIWREDHPNSLESRLRIAGKYDGGQAPDPEEPRIESRATLSIPGAAADYVIEQNGSGDATAHWLFTWNRSGTSAQSYAVTLSLIPVIGTVTTHVMPQGIDSVILIKRPAAPPQVAFSLDHGSVVKIYNFDGTNLTLHDTIAPSNGRRASGLVPWKTNDANGGFTLLERDGTTGPTTHTTRYARDGIGHYAPVGTDALPHLSKLARSNVFLWQGEPMVRQDAVLVGQRRAGDWTSSVTASLNTTQATAESFVSSTQGLANPAPSAVGDVPENASHVSGNQASSSLSIFSYDPAIGSITDVRVNYSPAAGRYAGEILSGNTPTLNVTLSFQGGYTSKLLYRVNGGAWQILLVNAETATKTLSISGDTVIESMSYVSPSPFGGGIGGGIGGGLGGPAPGFSRIFRAAYSVGPAPIPPTSGTDANGNGLMDEWESLLNINNPTGDDDGDGQSNFAEHNVGTDPRDATQFFTPPASLPVLSLTIEPSASGPCICARWPTDDPSVRLESSTRLGGGTWSPPNTGTVIEGNQFVFRRLPTPGENARFFRLARY